MNGAGTDGIFSSKWAWFNRMSFLWDVIGYKRTASNVSFDISDRSLVTHHDDTDQESTASDAENLQNVEVDTSIPAKKMKFSNNKVSVRDNNMEMLDPETATGYSEPLKGVMHPVVKDNHVSEDEFDIFGKHVANELRMLKNPQTLRLAKFKINCVLFESQGGIPMTLQCNSQSS